MGSLAFYERDLEKTKYHFQCALDLNPNSPWILGRIGDLYNFLGDGKKALQYHNEAKLLDPFLPVYIREVEAVAHYVLGNYQDTVNVVSQLLNKSLRIHAYRVASLSQLGEEPLMDSAVIELLAAQSDFTIDQFLKTEFYRDDDIPQRLTTDLKNAGLS